MSTCWNGAKHKDGYSLICEILDMGFNKVELSHGLMLSKIPGIEKALKEKLFTVSGVHNFCPSPVEVILDAPDYYVYSSHKEYDRERALNLTYKSIDYAERVGGKYIVLHMGFVPMKQISKEIKKLMESEYVDYLSVFKKKKELLETRQKKAGILFNRSRDALYKIAEYAEKKKIKLGVESRNSPEEIPSESEMCSLMEEFKDNPWVGYWHDFGHVQVKHNIEFLDHKQWFNKMKPYLVGCHVHDVVFPGKDHHIPFTGGLNFDDFIPDLDEDIPLVFELSSRRNKEKIIKSAEFWKKRYGE